MIATCNSVYDGMNPPVVSEMFRYERSDFPVDTFHPSSLCF